MELSVINFSTGALSEKISVNKDIFASEVREDIITKVIKWQLANRRLGNHKTKGRSEVHHTTKKPFKQKGTGQARQGMKGVAQMRGGGVVFGPIVRDHSIKLNKKVRRIGLKSVISKKLQENRLIILDGISGDVAKTKQLKMALDKISINNALFVVSDKLRKDGFGFSLKNLYKLDCLPVVGLNVYDVLNHDILVIEKECVSGIEERLNG